MEFSRQGRRESKAAASPDAVVKSGFVVAAFLIAASLLTFNPKTIWAADAPSASAVVLVSRANNACFSSTVRGNGFLTARNDAIVNLDAEGFRITEVLVQQGDEVNAGQSLVRLSRRATGGGEAATAVLRAPAGGVITQSTATVGAVASPRAEPLFRIAVDKELEILVDVPGIHIAKLAAGQTARVAIAGERELSGRVRLVYAEIDKASQLGRVRIAVENIPFLRVGMFATATIDAIRSCGVSVPRSAVLYRSEGTSVQVIRNRTVETRLVRVGLLSDSDAEIREGVAENELVVANAGTSLREGDKVKPIFAANLQEAGD